MNNLIIIDAIWLTVAFLSGLLFRKFNLPALLGFLLTGLILNAFNLNKGNISDLLQVLSDLGILLLLFTIGLKIKIQQIFKKEIWVTTSLHIVISIVLIGLFLFIIGVILGSYVGNLSLTSSLILGFALSFSSTVFVIKTLEDRGELNSYHGKIAIGVLVIQDIFAVLFLTFATDLTPNLFSLLLPVYLYFVRYLLRYLLNQSLHGELLTIFGFFATFVTGALVFYLAGLKPDLGALIIGMLLVNEKKSDELYDRMMSYKDFFLVAFFINIGLTGMPTLKTILIALALLPIIIVKGKLFMYLFSKHKMRARTAFLASLSLSNYSEFALIVILAGVNMNLLSQDWIMIIALMMTFSFLISAPINSKAHLLFDRFKPLIMKLNKHNKYIDEEPKSIGDAEIVIIGFGSVGKPAYKYFENNLNQKVVAIDYNHEIVKKYKNLKYNIQWGDTTNSIFWEGIDFSKVKMVVFAITDFNSNLNSIKELNLLKNRSFKTAAICSYIDEAKTFKEMNIDYIYDYKIYLGADFAEQSFTKLKSQIKI